MQESGHCSTIEADFSKLNMIPSSSDIGEDFPENEEVLTPDSTHNYIPGSYSCEKYDYSSTSNHSNLTITSTNAHPVPNTIVDIHNNLQIPIVGYEVMEERARFTVFKLRVENKSSGDCWYVFRRYTDFMRLCSRLKHSYPSLALLMPRKKYFGNNFDPTFLEERVQGLQTFVNAVISIPALLKSSQIQDFFCLNEPPAYSDTSDESRAIFEALEDTIYHLRHQLREKESTIESLQGGISDQKETLESLYTFLRNSTKNCQKCCKDYENYQKVTQCSQNDQNDKISNCPDSKE